MRSSDILGSLSIVVSVVVLVGLQLYMIRKNSVVDTANFKTGTVKLGKNSGQVEESPALVIEDVAPYRSDYPSDLARAVISGDVSLFFDVKNRGIDIHSDNDYALVLAVRSGQVKMVSVLLVYLDHRCRDDEPLRVAAHSGQKSIFKMILYRNLGNDGKVIIESPELNKSEWQLYETIRKNPSSPTIVKQIEQLYDTYPYSRQSLGSIVPKIRKAMKTDTDGQTRRVIEAVTHGNTEALRAELDAGFDVNYESGALLIVATQLNKNEIVDLLLKSGLNIRNTGHIALMLATHNENDSLINMLTMAGASTGPVRMNSMHASNEAMNVQPTHALPKQPRFM